MSKPKPSSSSYGLYTKQYQQDQPTTYDNDQYQYQHSNNQQQPFQQSNQYNTLQQQHQPPNTFSSSHRSNAYYANTVSPSPLFATKRFYDNASSKLKWRNIMKIDLAALKASTDISIINPYLPELLESNVTEDDVASVPEGNVVKLIQIYQYLLMYLITFQETVVGRVKALEEEKAIAENSYHTYEAKYLESEKKVNKLKKEKQNDKIVLTNYKNAILELQGRIKRGELAHSDNGNGSSSCAHEGEYSCDICVGKKFNSKDKLNDHMRKLHYTNKEESKTNEHAQPAESNVEKKLNELIEYFKNNNNNNSSSNYNNMLKTMQQQQRYDDSEQNKRLDDFERSVNNNLQEIKNLYLQTLNNNNKQASALPPQQTQHVSSHQQQQQQNYILQQYNSAVRELQDQLREKSMNEQNLQREINEMKAQLRMMHENDERKRAMYQQQQQQPPQHKSYAGQLESDHDDSDEEKQALKEIQDIASQLSKHAGIEPGGYSQIPKRPSSKTRSVKNQRIVDKNDNVEHVFEQPQEIKFLNREAHNSKLSKKNSISTANKNVNDKPANFDLQAFYNKYRQRDSNYISTLREYKDLTLNDFKLEESVVEMKINDTYSMITNKLRRDNVPCSRSIVSINDMNGLDVLKNESKENLSELINSVVPKYFYCDDKNNYFQSLSKHLKVDDYIKEYVEIPSKNTGGRVKTHAESSQRAQIEGGNDNGNDMNQERVVAGADNKSDFELEVGNI